METSMTTCHQIPPLRSSSARVPSWGLYPVLMITIGVLCAPRVIAADALNTYTAHYETSMYGMNLDIERKLVETEAGYQLSSQGKSFAASLSEVADFSVSDGRIVGQQFIYQLKSLVKRRREVHFLPEQGIIRSLKKKKWTEFPWEADALDRLSQQEQLRLTLINAEENGDAAPESLTFIVIDGPKRGEKILDLVGVEELDTALGPLETLHYRRRYEADSDRSSDIWVAPSLDFLMVLTRHEEDGSPVELSITSAELDG